MCIARYIAKCMPGDSLSLSLKPQTQGEGLACLIRRVSSLTRPLMESAVLSNQNISDLRTIASSLNSLPNPNARVKKHLVGRTEF